MAWQDSMPLMLRYLIGDIDTPQTYSDTRLQTSLLIAAKFVGSEANFSQRFNPDYVNLTLIPDPTIDPTIDDWYTNLTVMKASCQILIAEWKILVGGGAIMFKEGSAMVDMRELARHKKDLVIDIEKQYEHAKLTYQMAVRPSVASVIGPFNIYAGNFRGPVYPYSQRDRVFI